MLIDLFGDDQDDQVEVISTSNTKSFGDSRKTIRKPIDSRSEYGFMGLENQGATCYLNSLLQSMYMTPELRKGLYAIDPVTLGADQVRLFYI